MVKIQDDWKSFLYYWFCRCHYFIQNDIAQTLSHFFFNPLLYYAEKVDVTPKHIKEEQPNVIRIDTLKNPVLYKLFTFTSINISKFSGIHNSFNIYRSISDWNESYPILAFKTVRTIKSIICLFESPNNDNWRRVDWGLYVERQEMGRFKILEKDLVKKVRNEELTFKCIWVSGKNKGSIFVINRFEQSHDSKIDYIYIPPGPTILLFELCLLCITPSIFIKFYHYLNLHALGAIKSVFF